METVLVPQISNINDWKEHIVIPKYIFDEMQNVLRMTNNIYHTYNNETAYNRSFSKAYEFANEIKDAEKIELSSIGGEEKTLPTDATELAKAVAYGLGYITAKHNLELDHEQVKKIAWDYANEKRITVTPNREEKTLPTDEEIMRHAMTIPEMTNMYEIGLYCNGARWIRDELAVPSKKGEPNTEEDLGKR